MCVADSSTFHVELIPNKMLLTRKLHKLQAQNYSSSPLYNPLIHWKFMANRWYKHGTLCAVLSHAIHCLCRMCECFELCMVHVCDISAVSQSLELSCTCILTSYSAYCAIENFNKNNLSSQCLSSIENCV